MPKISMKAARVNANLTLDQAAASLGVTSRTLRNWEKGKTYPDYGQAVMMANLYQLPIEFINLCKDFFCSENPLKEN